MARIAGKDGSFKISGSEIKGINKWSLKDSAPEKDVTGFDSGDHGTYINLRPNATINFSGHWDNTEAVMYGNGGVPALAAGVQGVTVQCWINASKYFQATVNINDVTYDVDVDGTVDFTGDCRVTGSITYPAGTSG